MLLSQWNLSLQRDGEKVELLPAILNLSASRSQARTRSEYLTAHLWMRTRSLLFKITYQREKSSLVAWMRITKPTSAHLLTSMRVAQHTNIAFKVEEKPLFSRGLHCGTKTLIYWEAIGSQWWLRMTNTDFLSPEISQPALL